jgi:fructoselysine 6-kinase
LVVGISVKVVPSTLTNPKVRSLMTESTIDVAVVGDNTIDRFVDEPELGDLIGGNALNVAVQLAMLGIKVGYFGAVGMDAEAEVVRQGARVRGVDVSGMVAVPGATALTTIRRDSNGDRRFESELFGVTEHYHPDAKALQRIVAARWVHIGMLRGARRLGEQIASLSAVPVSQDCTVSPEWHRLAVSFASAGEDEEKAERIISDALVSSDIAVATLGSEGARCGRANTRWQLAAEPVDVVDTTGAGDSFMAGFIAARLRAENEFESLRHGVARGAFTCQYRGGWPQVRVDVDQFG